MCLSVFYPLSERLLKVDFPCRSIRFALLLGCLFHLFDRLVRSAARLEQEVHDFLFLISGQNAMIYGADTKHFAGSAQICRDMALSKSGFFLRLQVIRFWKDGGALRPFRLCESA